jgi:hypothetical protein
MTFVHGSINIFQPSAYSLGSFGAERNAGDRGEAVQVILHDQKPARVPATEGLCPPVLQAEPRQAPDVLPDCQEL